MLHPILPLRRAAVRLLAPALAALLAGTLPTLAPALAEAQGNGRKSRAERELERDERRRDRGAVDVVADGRPRNRDARDRADDRREDRPDRHVARRRQGPARVPRGHLPPPGMCRVWIEGVPPGRQSAPTDCGTAEARATRVGNARVIYGERERDRADGRRERRDDPRDSARDARTAVPLI